MGTALEKTLRVYSDLLLENFQLLGYLACIVVTVLAVVEHWR